MVVKMGKDHCTKLSAMLPSSYFKEELRCWFFLSCSNASSFIMIS